MIKDLLGKTAVVTGGGSGIGRGLVHAFVEVGMNVVVADVEEEAAQAVSKEAETAGVQALAVRADVADNASVLQLADASFDRFGAVHVLCNNAGVFIMGRLLDAIVEDWSWILSVNVMGVVHGIHAFLPRMLDQGEGHIVNTSSVVFGQGGGIYGTSKVAVLSLTEQLNSELEPLGLGASALMPANINSRILGAQRNRPPEFGREAAEPFGREATTVGLDPIHVGRRGRQAVQEGILYATVWPEGWQDHLRPGLEKRCQELHAALDTRAVAD